jgi:hypothetical protein
VAEYVDPNGPAYGAGVRPRRWSSRHLLRDV